MLVQTKYMGPSGIIRRANCTTEGSIVSSLSVGTGVCPFRTSSNSVVSIFEEGFQDKPHLTHGAAFGSGIYFTECSSKADMYTVPAEHTEARH